MAFVEMGLNVKLLGISFLLVVDLGAKCSALRKYQLLVINIPPYNTFTNISPRKIIYS